MAARVAAIHVLAAPWPCSSFLKKDVDARDGPGHDGGEGKRLSAPGRRRPGGDPAVWV